jgi:hypothetical protein
VKTPREILLQQHRETQPKLDAIRHAVLAKETQSADTRMTLLEMLQSLRWHLVGMSTVWLLVLVLRADANRAPVLAAAVPKPPPPQVVIASMREHRRMLSEMADAHPVDAEPGELFLPRPHSEARREFLVA